MEHNINSSAAMLFLKDNTSLVQLLDRKIDLLVQLVPAFIIGLHFQKNKGTAVLLGVIIGLFVSLVIPFGGFALSKMVKYMDCMLG